MAWQRRKRVPYVRWGGHKKPLWEDDVPSESQRAERQTLWSKRKIFLVKEMANRRPLSRKSSMWSPGRPVGEWYKVENVGRDQLTRRAIWRSVDRIIWLKLRRICIRLDWKGLNINRTAVNSTHHIKWLSNPAQHIKWLSKMVEHGYQVSQNAHFSFRSYFIT